MKKIKPTPMNNLLTLKTAAALGYASYTALKQACQHGRIEASKLGRDWIVTPEALEAAGYLPNSVKPNEVIANTLPTESSQTGPQEDVATNTPTANALQTN